MLNSAEASSNSSYFSFQPVLHDWCKKGHGMYYPVCEMMHKKEPLLLIEKRQQRVSSLADNDIAMGDAARDVHNFL